MPQPLQEILDSLNPIYNPQRDLVNQQLGVLPQYQQTQQAGLDQAKVNAFQDITSGANARGVLYSGVPIDEQAKYVGSSYLPATAKLTGDVQNQRFALQDMLNKIVQAQSTQAYGILSQQQQLEEKQRQFDQTLAAQKASASASAQGGMDLATLLGLGAGGGGNTGGQANSRDISSLLKLDSQGAVKSLFEGYNPAQDKGYTENVAIPILTEYFAKRNPKLGTEAQTLAGSLAYRYRKQAFGIHAESGPLVLSAGLHTFKATVTSGGGGGAVESNATSAQYAFIAVKLV